jgi:hypothetical protein
MKKYMRLCIMLCSLVFLIATAPAQNSPVADQTPPLGYPAAFVPKAFQKQAKELEKVKAEIIKTLTPAQVKAFKAIEIKKNNAMMELAGKMETEFKEADRGNAEPSDEEFKKVIIKFRPARDKVYVAYSTALRAAATKKQLPLVNKYLTLDKLVADETEKALVEGKE